MPPLTLFWPKCTCDWVHRALERVITELVGDGVRLGVDPGAEVPLGRPWIGPAPPGTRSGRRSRRTCCVPDRGRDRCRPRRAPSNYLRRAWRRRCRPVPAFNKRLRMIVSPEIWLEKAREPMSDYSLVYPMLALVLLTFGVAVVLFRARVRSVREGHTPGELLQSAQPVPRNPNFLPSPPGTSSTCSRCPRSSMPPAWPPWWSGQRERRPWCWPGATWRPGSPTPGCTWAPTGCGTASASIS